MSLREGPDAPAAEPSAARSPGEAKVAPSTPAEAAPGNRAPAPKKDSVPPSLRSKKASAHLPFFEVDLMPYQPPTTPLPPAKGVRPEDAGPDSGLVDILGMIALEQKAQKEVRADADLFNLSGGLFGNGPVVPLTPPDLSSLGGPVETGRSSSVGRPPVSTRVAPVFLPSASPTSQGRKQTTAFSAAKKLSARVGWAVALISAGAALVLISLKLGASLGTDESGELDAGATATATAAGAGAEATLPRETAVSVPTGPQATSSSGGPAKKPSASPSAGPRQPPTPATAGAAPGKGGVGAASPPGAPPAPLAAPPPSPPSAGAEFSVAAAKAALIAAAGGAMGCKKPDDPSGGARVSVIFAPSGRVTSARVTGPPFQGTPTGGCIASSFRSATVPPFDGPPVTVTKEVSIR